MRGFAYSPLLIVADRINTNQQLRSEKLDKRTV
jgi:hypothetical protein